MVTEIIERCRDKQFKILCAVKEICDRNGIRFFLLGDAALVAYKGEFATDDIAICIDAADIYKFRDAFERDRGSLVMDSMLTNENFPAFEFRVYDPESIDFNVEDFMKYRYNSLYVRVLFVMHVPKIRIKKATLNSLKGAYAINNRLHFGERQVSASRMVRILQKQEKKKGRDHTAKWVFNKLAQGYASASENILINEVPFRSSILGNGLEVEVDGLKFLIPEQAVQYFNRIYGLQWPENNVKRYHEGVKCFRDADHSWAEFRERISYMDFDGYRSDIKEYYVRSKAFNEYHRDITKYRNILTRTDMRFKLWQKYMPMKDELMSLHEKGDYEALKGLLEEYMLDLELCEEKELGLCFDEDILNIALDVYRNRGDAEYAERLNSLVPQEHREVLHIMDYKGNIIA